MEPPSKISYSNAFETNCLEEPPRKKPRAEIEVQLMTGVKEIIEKAEQIVNNTQRDESLDDKKLRMAFTLFKAAIGTHEQGYKDKNFSHYVAAHKYCEMNNLSSHAGISNVMIIAKKIFRGTAIYFVFQDEKKPQKVEIYDPLIIKDKRMGACSENSIKKPYQLIIQLSETHFEDFVNFLSDLKDLPQNPKDIIYFYDLAYACGLPLSQLPENYWPTSKKNLLEFMKLVELRQKFHEQDLDTKMRLDLEEMSLKISLPFVAIWSEMAWHLKESWLSTIFTCLSNSNDSQALSHLLSMEDLKKLDFRKYLKVFKDRSHFNNFTLKLCEEEEISVNLGILAASSDYFKAIQNNSFKEKENCDADLQMADSRVVNAILDYCYQEILQDDFFLLPLVYSEADYFGIVDLKSKSLNLIKTKISLDNYEKLLPSFMDNNDIKTTIAPIVCTFLLNTLNEKNFFNVDRSLFGPLPLVNTMLSVLKEYGPLIETYSPEKVTRISDSFLEFLCTSCPNLQTVDLSKLKGITITGLEKLKGLSKLKNLSLGKMKANIKIDDILNCLNTFSPLTNLSLSSCLDISIMNEKLASLKVENLEVRIVRVNSYNELDSIKTNKYLKSLTIFYRGHLKPSGANIKKSLEKNNISTTIIECSSS